MPSAIGIRAFLTSFTPGAGRITSISGGPRDDRPGAHGGPRSQLTAPADPLTFRVLEGYVSSDLLEDRHVRRVADRQRAGHFGPIQRSRGVARHSGNDVV